ncbi:MAG: D-alanine--D-alanine ligase A, partial [Parachlamydiaceae bacterium]
MGVVFGGRSVEHEISLVSARNIVSGFDPKRYEIRYFGISKEGVWVSGLEAYNQLKNGTCIEASGEIVSDEVLQELRSCSIVFPILHGPYGEDGTIQGFFETLGLPYVGCCHRSSAICMDKALTKELMLQHRIPTLE